MGLVLDASQAVVDSYTAALWIARIKYIFMFFAAMFFVLFSDALSFSPTFTGIYRFLIFILPGVLSLSVFLPGGVVGVVESRWGWTTRFGPLMCLFMAYFIVCMFFGVWYIAKAHAGSDDPRVRHRASLLIHGTLLTGISSAAYSHVSKIVPGFPPITPVFFIPLVVLWTFAVLEDPFQLVPTRQIPTADFAERIGAGKALCVRSRERARELVQRELSAGVPVVVFTERSRNEAASFYKVNPEAVFVLKPRVPFDCSDVLETSLSKNTFFVVDLLDNSGAENGRDTGKNGHKISFRNDKGVESERNKKIYETLFALSRHLYRGGRGVVYVPFTGNGPSHGYCGTEDEEITLLSLVFVSPAIREIFARKFKEKMGETIRAMAVKGGVGANIINRYENLIENIVENIMSRGSPCGREDIEELASFRKTILSFFMSVDEAPVMVDTAFSSVGVPPEYVVIPEGGVFFVGHTNESVFASVINAVVNLGKGVAMLGRRVDPMWFDLLGIRREDVIWVGKTPVEGVRRTIPPTPEIVRLNVEDMWKEGKDVVILECTEYLIQKVSFQRFLRLIWVLRESAAAEKKTLLVLIDPQLHGKREVLSLKREADIVFLPFQKISDVIMEENRIYTERQNRGVWEDAGERAYL